ncbi:putative cysteine desulfurase Csd [Gottschalkia purinilytica]|uniref:cysteine desulfurase n=1 Tax=Gottschalkia purinilytica TaxID=1503 RepID=A0A0L0WAY5_GOTPU|nr:cysteine desulfurase [Gottschalkia purinilytica]KNF08622.1 putative cysteine desulfurase Csd [Gottschalkia purinilytica]
MINYKKDFEVLQKEVNGSTIAYLDNAATTQKPKQVIEAIRNYNKNYNGSPHRGAHYLSIKATEIYEETRKKVSEFIGASKSEEIIFTKNATESLNLLAYSYGLNQLKEGDEIVLGITNHHSNIVPWQMISEKTGAKIVYIMSDKNGQLKKEEIESKINKKTKIVSVSHVSNTFGIIHPVEEIIKKAKEFSATVIIDGAQSIPHLKIDVSKLDPDFLVFSGHKMLASMGIGVLYGKFEKLKEMSPFLFGGDMIEYVDLYKTTYEEIPYRFEAGTQNVEGVVSLSVAIDYLNNIGMENVENKEKELLKYTLSRLKDKHFIELHGGNDTSYRTGIVSFNIKDVHPHDVATILDEYNIAIRSGHHCAQPFMKSMGFNSTCRISFYFYNTFEDIDRFIEAIEKVRGYLGYES